MHTHVNQKLIYEVAKKNILKSFRGFGLDTCLHIPKLLLEVRNHIRTVMCLTVASLPQNIQNTVLKHFKIKEIAMVHLGHKDWV